jgi:hypothetical protein
MHPRRDLELTFGGPMSPAFTHAYTSTLRDQLQRADQCLGKSLAEDNQNPGYKARLEFADSVVKDALRRVDGGGDARTILTSLDGIWIGDLNAAAARHVETARVLCRAIVKKAWPPLLDLGAFEIPSPQ